MPLLTSSPSWAVLACLRFVLASIVIFAHLPSFNQLGDFPPAIVDGKAAVVGFLLISGFSIRASLERQPHGFLTRRFLRIYPVYLVVCLLTMAAELVTNGVVRLPQSEVHTQGLLTNLGNLLLLQMFVVKAMGFNGPLWSISIEFFYYVCARWIRRQPRLWAAVAVVSMICFILPRRPELGPLYSALTRFNALTYAWPWIVGFFLASARWQVALAGLIGGELAVHFSQAYTEDPYSSLVYLGTVGTLLLAHRIPVGGWAERLLLYLGDISYPLYLVHFPVFIMLYHMTGRYGFTTYVGSALMAAIVLYEVVDRRLKPLIAPAILRRVSVTGARLAKVQ